MEFWLEGNELVVKSLFRKKRYSFRELTRINFEEGISIYIKEKCILHEKYAGIYQFDIYRLAVENDLIIEDSGWYDDEISVEDIHNYGILVRQELKRLLQEYVNQELGKEYEVVILIDETRYYIRLFLDVYCDGVKLCMNDKQMIDFYFEFVKGKREFHLASFELVMPEYVNYETQEFRMTKKVGYEDVIEDFKEQINEMKMHGMLPASQFEMQKNSKNNMII